MPISLFSRNTYKIYYPGMGWLPDLYRVDETIRDVPYGQSIAVRNQRTGVFEDVPAHMLQRVRRDGSPIQPQSKLSAIAGEFNFKRGRLRRLHLEVEAFAKSVGAQSDRPDIVHLFRYLDNLLVIQERQARSKLAITDQKKS